MSSSGQEANFVSDCNEHVWNGKYIIAHTNNSKLFIVKYMDIDHTNCLHVKLFKVHIKLNVVESVRLQKDHLWATWPLSFRPMLYT